MCTAPVAATAAVAGAAAAKSVAAWHLYGSMDSMESHFLDFCSDNLQPFPVQGNSREAVHICVDPELFGFTTTH